MDDADFDMINELMRQPVVRKAVSEEQRKKNEVASAAAVEAWRAALAAPPKEPSLHAVRAREAGVEAARAFLPDTDAVEAATEAVNAAGRAEQLRQRDAMVAAHKAARKAARAEARRAGAAATPKKNSTPKKKR